MQNNSQMVVATKYRLLEAVSLKDNKYNVNGSKENLGTKVIPRDYVEYRNSQVNNELYVIDEEATKEFEKQRGLNILKQLEEDKKAKVSNSDVVGALVEAISGKQPKEKKEVKKEEVKEDVNEYKGIEDDELKAMLTEKGVSFHHKAGRSKLIELLTNNK